MARMDHLPECKARTESLMEKTRGVARPVAGASAQRVARLPCRVCSRWKNGAARSAKQPWHVRCSSEGHGVELHFGSDGHARAAGVPHEAGRPPRLRRAGGRGALRAAGDSALVLAGGYL